MSDANPKHVREYIVEPALRTLGLYSPAAVQLLMGTAAHESEGFRHLRQMGSGPALSWWQIEPATYRDLLENTMPGMEHKRPDIAEGYRKLIPRQYIAWPPAEYLASSPVFAAATARLLYWRAPEALPAAGDFEGMAALWKLRYNTPAGKGKPEQWLLAYRIYCKES